MLTFIVGESELARRIRAYPWDDTELGALETWPESLKTLVSVMLAANQPMYTVWGPRQLLLYNDQYVSVLQGHHPSALGRPFLEVWSEIADDLEPLVKNAYAGIPSYTDDILLVLERSGHTEETHFAYSYTPVFNATGVVDGFFCPCIETTEQVKAAHLIRESEERQAFLLGLGDALRPLVDPAQIKSVATRLLGEQLAVNRAFYADAEAGHWLVSRGYEHGVAALPDQPFDMPEYGDWIIDGFLAGQRLVVNDMAADLRFDTSERDAHFALQIGAEVALPLVKNDQLVSMLVVHSASARNWSEKDLALLEEVAERTWAAVERARAESAVREGDRRKDEFLAVLSHELRNGLAPLVYDARIGTRSANLQEMAAVFARMDVQLGHVVRLVDDLLDVARITAGKIELVSELLRPREVVTLAIEACRAEIEACGHVLTVIDQTDTELLVYGDRVRLTQVVTNLLSNATKYTAEGGNITVRLARDEEDAVIEVADDGIGIPEAALPRVFDLFSQVRTQQSNAAGGLGIGLALVRDLVGMHGGTAAAFSAGPGQGSTFSVRLPVATHLSTSAAETTPADVNVPKNRLHILVVDDLRDAADSLSELLRLDGDEVSVAYSGEEALREVRRRPPDLVLLDLGLPGIDGFEVSRGLQRIFADGRRPQIIALTGWGQAQDRQRSQEAGFDGHLTKPPRQEDLRSVVASARSRKALRDGATS
ncbi:MAG: response regulator [Proteobacteria bacterium]|nr:response regulator [Pseudomonadota bacterium]